MAMATKHSILLLLLVEESQTATALSSTKSNLAMDLNLKIRQQLPWQKEEAKSEKFNICPSPPKDDDLDRREALFATMGSMWSSGLLGDAVMVDGLFHRYRL